MSASLSKRAELMQIFRSSIYTFWNQTPQPLFKSFSWIWNEIRKTVLSPENCGDIILSYLKKKMNAFVHSTECWVRWKIWNLPSNSNIGFCPHSVHASHLPLLQQWGGVGEGGTKAILRKTDVARPMGSTRHCLGLFYTFYSSSSHKFLPQMNLFILQISFPSYQNSQLAPSEGLFGDGPCGFCGK